MDNSSNYKDVNKHSFNYSKRIKLDNTQKNGSDDATSTEKLKPSVSTELIKDEIQEENSSNCLKEADNSRSESNPTGMFDSHGINEDNFAELLEAIERIEGSYTESSKLDVENSFNIENEGNNREVTTSSSCVYQKLCAEVATNSQTTDDNISYTVRTEEKTDMRPEKSSENLIYGVDCNSLQTEYGFQHNFKFKCSNCEMSTFQSMDALHIHQVECKNNGQLLSPRSFKLLCLLCDKLFTEMNDCSDHKQPFKHENPYNSKIIKLDNTQGNGSADAISTQKLKPSVPIELLMKNAVPVMNPFSQLEEGDNPLSESTPTTVDFPSHGLNEDNILLKMLDEECVNFVPDKMKEDPNLEENKPTVEDIEHKEEKYFNYVTEGNAAMSKIKPIKSNEENSSVSTENNTLNIPRENESEDIQKIPLFVGENTNNCDIKTKKTEDEKKAENVENVFMGVDENNENLTKKKDVKDTIPLARESVTATAVTLDDNIEKVPIQLLLKEYVQAAYMSCNFCRHAVRIAVNGKQLALHLLSEHSCIPVKNGDDIRKLKSSLNDLDKLYLNSESYDSSDTSIHNPYDQKNNFNCLHCHYSSSNYKDLYAHNKKTHVQYHLLCIMCKINFYSYSELICHLCKGCYIPELAKSFDVSFRCCFCKLDMIPSAFRLMVHLRKIHHACDICLEIYTDQKKLYTHIWRSHKWYNLCYTCGIAYQSKSDMKEHLFWKHGTESVLCGKCLQKKWPHVYHFCIPPT